MPAETNTTTKPKRQGLRSSMFKRPASPEFVNVKPGEHLAVLRRGQLRWSTNGSPYLLLSYQTVEPVGEWASQWVFGRLDGDVFHSSTLEALGFKDGNWDLSLTPEVRDRGHWLSMEYNHVVFAFIDVEPAAYDPSRTQITAVEEWDFGPDDQDLVETWLRDLDTHNRPQ